MSIRFSYSGIKSFNSCEHKFALRKVYNMEEPRIPTPATQLGTAVGIGYQHWLANGRDYDLGLVALWANYPEYLQDKTRTHERAYEAYDAMIAATPSDWEIVRYNNKPAIELSFVINCGTTSDGVPLTYVGYLDAAIKSYLEPLMVLDLKTTVMELDKLDLMFKYSMQGLGYSIICKAIAKQEKISYNEADSTINYLIAVLPRAQYRDVVVCHKKYKKTLINRLEFLLGLQLDIERFNRSYDLDCFPRRETACLSWGRPCYYFDECSLSKERVEIPEDTTKYDFTFELTDLVDMVVAELDQIN